MLKKNKGYLCPQGLGEGFGKGSAGLDIPKGAKNKKKHPSNLSSIILDPALYQEVHQIYS